MVILLKNGVEVFSVTLDDNNIKEMISRVNIYYGISDL